MSFNHLSLFQAPPGAPSQETSNFNVVTEQPSISANVNKTTSNLTMPNTKLSNISTKEKFPHNENVEGRGK